jgi:hypothetical protein
VRQMIEAFTVPVAQSAVPAGQKRHGSRHERATNTRAKVRRGLCSALAQRKNQAAETGVGSTRPGLTAPEYTPSMPPANRSSYG